LRLPHAILGISCYADPARAEAAAALGADYVGIGSMFASRTKPNAVRAALECLGEARRRGGLPVAAIGGITAGNAGQAIAAGADMIAVVSALFDAPDIAAAARQLSTPFATHESSDARAQPAAI
jgi:thiamine-phosphate pyrophosphorylase